MNHKKQTFSDLPTAKQLENELKRLRYQQKFIKNLWNTVSSLIVTAAAAVIISTLFVPILRVTGTSMTPTLLHDEVTGSDTKITFTIDKDEMAKDGKTGIISGIELFYNTTAANTLDAEEYQNYQDSFAGTRRN